MTALPLIHAPVRIAAALLLCALCSSCVGESLHPAPARNVAYNPYISSRLIRSNPRGESGVVYRPASRAESSTTVREQYKEVVEYQTR